uniref:CDGSH iron-sulfur domain-containing protein 2 n=1 Tax=Apteryx owenii TaxID=8824 RepID=A0A8B9PHF4_APTOW
MPDSSFLCVNLSPVAFINLKKKQHTSVCGALLGCLQSKFHVSLVSEWLRLLPFLGVLALLGYLAVRPFLPKKKQQKDSLINLKIQKENPKVVNEINIEDLCLTKAYCRCWRSKTFPVCDGSHNKHNELTGDNVGPLILKKKEV